MHKHMCYYDNKGMLACLNLMHEREEAIVSEHAHERGTLPHIYYTPSEQEVATHLTSECATQTFPSIICMQPQLVIETNI